VTEKQEVVHLNGTLVYWTDYYRNRQTKVFGQIKDFNGRLYFVQKLGAERRVSLWSHQFNVITKQDAIKLSLKGELQSSVKGVLW
jgi:hypothetical protein